VAEGQPRVDVTVDLAVRGDVVVAFGRYLGYPDPHVRIVVDRRCAAEVFGHRRLRNAARRVDRDAQRRDGQAAAVRAADDHGVQADGHLAGRQVQTCRTRNGHFPIRVIVVEEERVEHQGDDEARDRDDHHPDGDCSR